jgi:hypothetical protein
MCAKDQPPRCHNNQYSDESACLECGGIIRCEPWCNIECSNVRYAHQAVLDPDRLSTGDQLILHALGVAWKAEKHSAKTAGHCMKISSRPNRPQQWLKVGRYVPGFAWIHLRIDISCCGINSLKVSSALR